jgi:rubrerythrin
MSTPQWFAEFERQEAMREERLDETRARLAEWRKRYPLPKKCIECGTNYADPPSKLCPGCEAYQEHTR